MMAGAEYKQYNWIEFAYLYDSLSVWLLYQYVLWLNHVQVLRRGLRSVVRHRAVLTVLQSKQEEN